MMTMDPSHNYERKMFTQVNKRNIFSQVSQIDLASNYIVQLPYDQYHDGPRHMVYFIILYDEW
jgi:DUF971 family protein